MTGAAASRASLKPAAAKKHLVGTHRTVEPARTLERLQDVLDRLGITRVAVVTGLDVIGIPVVMVCRPNGRSLSVAQGKGVDLLAAKVSGIMEAVEAWHAENVLLPLRLATYNELRRVARVVGVGGIARPRSSRFHPDLTILWIEGTDVFSAEPVWVPYECVHLDLRVPGPQGTGCFRASSAGLAAGNHVLEAVSHALCELVERDAFALWQEHGKSEQAARVIDADSVDDPGCRRLLDAFAAAGVGVTIFDLTTDVELPVFAATIVDRHTDAHRRVPAALGGGCHPDRAVALSRALTEAAQSRLTMIAGSRDDLSSAYWRQVRDIQAIRTNVGRLDGRPGRSFRDVPDIPGDSIDDDVAHELDRLRAVGLQRAVLVNLTRSDIGVPVVRMVVPGLEEWVDKVEPNARGERALAVRASR
jgi:ribosomal protein S12 methylthiotransferase accessory factor